MKRKQLASYLVAISITAASAIGMSVAQAELIHKGDFETGNLLQFNASQLPKPDSGTVVSSPRREGSKALRILLRKGDAPGRERAEVMPKAYTAFPGFKNNYTIGQEYWYAISMYLPADMVFDTDDETVFQFHAAPDVNLGEQHIVPPLALIINGSSWALKSRGDSRKVLYKSTTLQFDKRYSLGAVKRGAWTDWVFRVKWSYGADGNLQIWKDGQLVLDRKGMNCYNDALGPYLKLGIYKHGWINKTTLTTKRIMYFDAFRIYKGTTTVQGMMPSGAPEPSVPERDTGGTTGGDTASGSTDGTAGGSTTGENTGTDSTTATNGSTIGGDASGGSIAEAAGSTTTGESMTISSTAAATEGGGGGGAEAPFYLYLLAMLVLARSGITRRKKAW